MNSLFLRQFGCWFLPALLIFPTLNSEAANQSVAIEAVVQGGASAAVNVDEVAAGYIHVKHSSSLDLARKAYFQFDLTGLNADPNLAAAFTVYFKASNAQRVQLWALNQSYPVISSDITWNTAQANDTDSNALLSGGTFTATPIGADVLIPISGTNPFTFSISRLGDFLFGNKITLVLTGVADAANNSGGLRLQRLQSSLEFNLPPAPPTRYDVYLVAGQSNTDGRGAASELTGSLSNWAQPQSDVRIYYANPVNSNPANPTYNSGWQTLTPGFSVPPGFGGALPSSTFGPELAFARTVADANTNRHLALIKVSKGGTSLSSDWNPASGYMYATFTNMARVALSALTNEGAQYTLRGMIWHQGESDGSLSTSSYQSKLTQFINAVRRDFAATNLPFGELATNRSLTVRQAQFNVAEIMPYVGFASSSNLSTLAADDPHFTARSQLIMGQRMAAALEVPPTAITSINAGGTDVSFQMTGLAGASGRVLAATNLAEPLNQWIPMGSATFDPLGHANVVVPMVPGAAAEFFTIEPE
ncbi:MAG: sialate O-acetylesterase [Verrucomicrobiota bacterium]